MSGFLRADAIGYDIVNPPDTTQILFNEEKCSEANLEMNSNENGYNFEINYGSCGMSVSEKDEKIIFSTKLRNKSQIKRPFNIIRITNFIFHDIEYNLYNIRIG